MLIFPLYFYYALEWISSEYCLFSLWTLYLMLRYYHFKNEYTLYPLCFSSNQITSYIINYQSRTDYFECWNVITLKWIYIVSSLNCHAMSTFGSCLIQLFNPDIFATDTLNRGRWDSWAQKSDLTHLSLIRSLWPFVVLCVLYQ